MESPIQLLPILFFFYFMSYIYVCHLVAVNGDRKEIGYVKTFFVSFLFSPIVGSLLVMISPNLTWKPSKISETSSYFWKTESKDVEKEEKNEKKVRSEWTITDFLWILMIILLIIGVFSSFNK